MYASRNICISVNEIWREEVSIEGETYGRKELHEGMLYVRKGQAPPSLHEN